MTEARRPSNLILIIDDDLAILEMIAEFLSYEGYEIITRSDGRAALACASECGPALILLDLMMPEMSGWEVAAALRAHARTRAIPIILLSARRDLGRTAAEVGAVAYLEKPFDLDDLLALVRRYAPARAP